MEVPSDSQKTPLSTIKPIKYRQNKTIDSQNMAKSILHHPKNLKTTYSPLSHFLDQTKQRNRQPIKQNSKLFDVQDVTSSAQYSLNDKAAFQNEYFSSRIRKLSTSLSSFNLQAWDNLHETRSKMIFKSFDSLKNLRRFELWFISCEFPAKDDLHSLFKRLLYFKKMNYFSFFAFRCQEIETMHLKALCSSLARSPQLQYISLVCPGGNQLLDILTPALPKLTSLARFRLSLEGDNLIEAEGFIKLFLALSAIKTLKEITLHLNHCEIDSEKTSLEPLAEGLQYLDPSIRKLSFDLYKNLTDKNLMEISQALKKFTSLQILHIGLPTSQDITDEGLKHFSSTLSELSSLTSLSLVFSGFTKDLAIAFKSLQNLVSLKLSFKNPHPSQDQIQQLSSGLKVLKPSLKYLEIRFAEQSSLTDSMFESLTAALKELTLLKYFSLDLTATNFTYKGIEALGLAIQGLSNLYSLSLIFAKSEAIDEKSVSALSQALQSLPFLFSITLDFLKCYQIHSEGNGFQSFFGALKGMKRIHKLYLKLPICPEVTQEVEKLKQRFELRTLEFLNCVEIKTL